MAPRASSEHHWHSIDGSQQKPFFDWRSCITGEDVGMAAFANGRARHRPRRRVLHRQQAAAALDPNLFTRILAYEANPDAGSSDADELNDVVDEARLFCCQPIGGPLDPLASPQ